MEAFVNERESSLQLKQQKVRNLCALFGQHMGTFVGQYCQKMLSEISSVSEGNESTVRLKVVEAARTKTLIQFIS